MTTRSGASAALARIDALHSALTELVLEGGDLDRIAAEAARVLDLGVVITSTDGRERASAVSEELRAALADAGLVDDTGRLRVERAGADGVPLGKGEARVLRVVAGGTDLARLVVCRAKGTITQDDVHALERAAAVAALLITREQAVSAVETKYQGDFLRDLFLGRAGDTAYVTGHLASFGWDLTRPIVVVCAEMDPAPADAEGESAQHRLWQERFAQAFRQVTRDVGDGIPTADFSSEVVCLLPALEKDRLGHDVVRRVVKSVAGDKGGGRRPFTVGVSRVISSLEELPGAYAQARRALAIGKKLQGSGSTTFFDQLGVHRLFALVPDPLELRAFAHDVLGPLAERTEDAAKARETLQVLLDTNFNVAEAAREQFVHYNTLRYRVSKLERQLGPLSTDPHLRLDVAVALRVLDIS